MDAEKFTEKVTIRELIGIPDAALEETARTAYRLYKAGQFGPVEILCRGLIAADHKNPWPYSLYAGALRGVGRLAEAVQVIDAGLARSPQDENLRAMRVETAEEFAKRTATAAKTGKEVLS